MQTQLLEPADKSIDLKIKNVLIVNNSANIFTSPSAGNLENMTLYFSGFFCNELQYQLKQSPRFAIADTIITSSDSSGFIPTSDKIKEICDSTDADGLLVLETYMLESVPISCNAFQASENCVSLCLSVKMQLYEAINGLPVDRYENYYQIYSGPSEYVSDALVYNSAEEASSAIAVKYSNKISPYWKTTTRYYYSGLNTQMMNAADLASKDQWASAADIWRPLAEGKNKRLAAKASFNMALASEMLGKIDLALFWARKAYSLSQHNLMPNYLEILTNRQNKVLLLNTQMETQKAN